MSGKTSIQWATAVWNPTTGCTRVSAGCDNCYAFALHDKRYASNLKAARAAAALPASYAPARLEDLPTWARRLNVPLPWPACYDLPFSRVQMLKDRLEWPLRHKKPERIFVDSMADLFHEDVTDEFIVRVWSIMQNASWHMFLILTKRPERMRRWVVEYEDEQRGLSEGTYVTAPNIGLGTSVEDQKAADERIPHLLATPAAVRFLSCEPLLGPVDVEQYLWGKVGDEDRGVSWVIVGGESGPRARPMDLAWARSLVAQCRAAGVAPCVKQLGSRPYALAPRANGIATGYDHQYLLRGKGGDMDEWPENLRVREFPR